MSSDEDINAIFNEFTSDQIGSNPVGNGGVLDIACRLYDSNSDEGESYFTSFVSDPHDTEANWESLARLWIIIYKALMECPPEYQHVVREYAIEVVGDGIQGSARELEIN